MSTVAGFGLTSQGASNPPDQLQAAQVPITTDEYCAQAYPGGLSTAADSGSFDPKTMVCAGYPEGGTDTCEGDSGGPLLAPVSATAFRLVAATSFGSGCAQPGKPGVYARLAEGPIRDWIRSVAPEAFAPEPAAKTLAAKTKKNRATRRCSRRRAPAHGRHARARSRSCRRVSRK
jgi:secreted trypsin-like serine protease